MEYTSKIISVEKALGFVKSNDYIVTGLGCSVAAAFCSRLHTIADRVEDVTLSHCLPLVPPGMETPRIYEAAYSHAFLVDGWFYAPIMRKAHQHGHMAYIPNHLHLSAKNRLDYRKPDIYIGAASMPDKHGFISLSLSNTYEQRMMEAAQLVILEINPNYPYTLGDVQIPVSQVDHLIPVDYPVPEMEDLAFGEKEQAIGSFIAPEVPDGACIQLGIGGIPNAVAAALGEKNDLGVHTEMLTNSMMRLAKQGNITGRCKQMNRGKMVATFAIGSRELYDYMDYNPSVAILDGGWVNDPYVIGQNDNQISINTSVEVDLTGQCASESIGFRQISGTGGQADTAIGAQISRGGKSFIALYSTAQVKDPETGERREVSKIVPSLQQGAAVTLHRSDVDRVVTEYGIAELRGTSVRERVSRLIAIAHPKFRDALWEDAYRHGIVCKR